MRYSAIIPTNRAPKDIAPTLDSLGRQTKLPDRIFILYDKSTSHDGFQEYSQAIDHYTPKYLYKRIIIIWEHTADFKAWQWVSYVRNYGILCVQTEYLLSVDDDNTFDADFIQSFFSSIREIQKPSLLIPTEYHQGQIRSRGYRWFSYVLGIQLPCKKQWPLVPIQFAASNCLFGPTDLFQEIQFDPQMKFVYEDFDMTRRVTKLGYGLYVTDTTISHNMQPKTPLQETYIDTPFRAQQKAKNRVLFVRKNARARQRMIYALFGVHIHTCFLLLKLFWHPTPHKTKIGRIIVRTTYATLFRPHL